MRRVISVLPFVSVAVFAGVLGTALVIPADAAGHSSRNVIVTNTPLPVTGTVNVGNFPATQPVSGTVTVGNFPATQSVSGTVTIGNSPTVVSSVTTHVVMKGSVTLPANGHTNVGVANADVSAFKELRLTMFCISPSDCSPASFSAVTPDLVSGGLFRIDGFSFPAVTFGVTRTYDLPGTTGFQVLGINPGPAPITIDFVLYGRGN